MEEELKKIDVEVIKKLLEKAEETEMQYLLFLETNARPGECYEDVTTFKIIYGEAEEIPLERHYSYPTENSTKWLIVPKTIPVIVEHHHWDDYEGVKREWRTIYIFTAEGWKRIHVY